MQQKRSTGLEPPIGRKPVPDSERSPGSSEHSPIGPQSQFAGETAELHLKQTREGLQSKRPSTTESSFSQDSSSRGKKFTAGKAAVQRLDIKQMLNARREKRLFKSPKKVPKKYADAGYLESVLAKGGHLRSPPAAELKGENVFSRMFYKNEDLLTLHRVDLSVILHKLYHEHYLYDDIFDYLPLVLKRVPTEIVLHEHLIHMVKTFCTGVRDIVLRRIRRIKERAPFNVNLETDQQRLYVKCLMFDPKGCLKVIGPLYNYYKQLESAAIEVQKVLNLFFMKAGVKAAQDFDCLNFHRRYFLTMIYSEPSILNFLIAVYNFHKNEPRFPTKCGKAISRLMELYTTADADGQVIGDLGQQPDLDAEHHTGASQHEDQHSLAERPVGDEEAIDPVEEGAVKVKAKKKKRKRNKNKAKKEGEEDQKENEPVPVATVEIPQEKLEAAPKENAKPVLADLDRLSAALRRVDGFWCVDADNRAVVRWKKTELDFFKNMVPVPISK